MRHPTRSAAPRASHGITPGHSVCAVNLETPDVRYARSGDVSIAYQVVGEGPVDLLFVPFMINLVWAWEQPIFVDFCRQAASFSRLILFDKRGTGLSDRPRELPTLETRMDDIRAVMDDAGSDRAALLGAGSPGGQLCALFAATYPERVVALVLHNTWPRVVSGTRLSVRAARSRSGTGACARRGSTGERASTSRPSCGATSRASPTTRRSSSGT